MRPLFQKKLQRGFTIMYAVLVTSLMLAVTLKLYNIVVKEQILSSATRVSEISFYGANGGLECALYADLHAPPSTFNFYKPGSGNPTNTFTCNGANVGLTGSGTNSANAVWQEVCQPKSGVGVNRTDQCGASKFTVTFESSCAVVSVAKVDLDGDGNFLTYIESRGYNTTTCPGAGTTISERALRSLYGQD